MALNAGTLATLIKAGVDAIDIENGEVPNDDVLMAVAQAIVDHLTTDGEVIVTSGSSAGTYGIT
jgi:hypothetical protein